MGFHSLTNTHGRVNMSMVEEFYVNYTRENFDQEYIGRVQRVKNM